MSLPSEFPTIPDDRRTLGPDSATEMAAGVAITPEPLPSELAFGTVVPLTNRADTLRQLQPDLRQHLERQSDGTLMLRSPWCYQVPLWDVAQANDRATWARRGFFEALHRNELTDAMLYVEKPYQINMLSVFPYRATPAQLREALATIWCGQEFVARIQRDALKLFRRAGFFSVGEQKTDADRDASSVSQQRPDWLQGEITLYRGADRAPQVGMCWTRDRELAKWFAMRFPLTYGVGDPVLLTARVEAKHVLASFAYESTVIIDPKHARIVERTPLTL